MTHAGVGRNDPCPCGSGRKYKHCCSPQRSTRAVPTLDNVPEQAVCQCGRTYVPQDYLTGIADQPSDFARCPACGKELSLATCTCGQPLTSEHREVPSTDVWLIARSVVEFRCPACGRRQAVKLRSREYRPVIALCAAVVMGAIGVGLTLWREAPTIQVVLIGVVCAVGGAAAFYCMPDLGWRMAGPPKR